MKKTKIEWCDATWNPVTGCYHGCEYCYAKRIAERFGKKMPDFSPYPRDHAGVHMVDSQFTDNPYPFLFEPTFHAYRLGDPARWTNPRTIFVCSMADLFGAWVPDEWISEVLDACKAAPQHRYLFLTKNPARYVDLEQKGILPHHDNYWFGTTITKADDKAMWCNGKGFHSFASIEPLLGEIHLPERDRCPEWIIIGAETGNRKDKVVPEPKWVYDLQLECDDESIPVFMKDSLIPIAGEGNMRREFPWDKD